MELIIYTYGHIDAIYYVISGIAMIMNSEFADLMIKTISIISASYWALKASYASSAGGGKHYLVKIFGMICVVNILLVPKTTISIKDHVTKKVDRVDNLPYGFAVPIGIMENFGEIISRVFEQAFRNVDNLDYRNYGMVFGARLVKESRNWRIKNPEFIYNMQNFIRRCVILDIGMQNKYGIRDLLENKAAWDIVKSSTSNFRNLSIRRDNRHFMVSCRQAANEYFEEYFSEEIDNTISRYANNIFSLAGSNSNIFTPRGKENIRSFFKANIESILGFMSNESMSAETRLKQYMMLHSFSDFTRNYGFARSAMNQESNWKIAGDLASYYLPIMLSVMKGLIYASFVFMVPIMLLGAGFAKYMGYITIILSIQLWPCLNSILNLFVDLYSSSEMKDIAERGISFANFNMVGDYAEKIVSVAAGLELIVPFLAFSIVQGGVSGFIHLANTITSASSNAASIAANEITSGNRSFDNYSSSNLQLANRSAFKTDYNSSYREGMREWQNVDGTMERSFQDGSSILQSGMGLNISGGGAKFSVRRAASDQISKDISSAESLLETTSKSYREAEYDTLNKVSSLLSQVARRDYYGQNIDVSDSEEYSKSLGHYISQTQSIRESTGKSWDKSANLAIRASAGMGFLGASGSVDISGNVTQNYNKSSSHDNQLSVEDALKEDYSEIIRIVSSEQFSRSNNIELSYSDDIRKSYEKQKSFEKQMSIQKENLKRYNEAFAKINSSEAGYEFDMYDDIQKKVAEEMGISTKDAHNLIEKQDPRINKIWDNMVEKYKGNFLPMKISADQINYDYKAEDFEDEHRGKINSDTSININEK